MNHLPGLLVILFLVQVADAQEKSAAMAFLDSRCKHRFISLSPKKVKNTLNEAFPFRQIEVVDYRPDSLRIGLFSVNGQLTDLRFDSAPGSVIRYFLNEAYANPTATKTLLIVIKDLWFSDIVYEPSATPSRLRSRIRLRFETYVKEESTYVPLASFDTLVNSKIAVVDIAPFIMPRLMSAFINKIGSVNMDHAILMSRRHLSLGAVDSFNNRSMTYPITTAGALQRGVYASFEEFRNNNPSISNYKVTKENNASMSLELIDEEGKLYYSRRMWGYCDGQQTFVMMDGNLFPIINYGRAFYVYGSKTYRVKTTRVPIFLLFPVGIVAGTIAVSETVTRNLRFFRLDIQTGGIQ